MASSPSGSNQRTPRSTHLKAILLSLPSIYCADNHKVIQPPGNFDSLTGTTIIWEVFLSGFPSSEKSFTPRPEVQSKYHHFARMWKCENLPRLKSKKNGIHNLIIRVFPFFYSLASLEIVALIRLQAGFISFVAYEWLYFKLLKGRLNNPILCIS